MNVSKALFNLVKETYTRTVKSWYMFGPILNLLIIMKLQPVLKEIIKTAEKGSEINNIGHLIMIVTSFEIKNQCI